MWVIQDSKHAYSNTAAAVHDATIRTWEKIDELYELSCVPRDRPCTGCVGGTAAELGWNSEPETLRLCPSVLGVIMWSNAVDLMFSASVPCAVVALSCLSGYSARVTLWLCGVQQNTRGEGRRKIQWKAQTANDCTRWRKGCKSLTNIPSAAIVAVSLDWNRHWNRHMLSSQCIQYLC